MVAEPCIDLALVLFRLKTAGAVDQAAARFQKRGRAVEQRSLQGRDLAKAFRIKAPTGIGTAAQDACVGAGDIKQDTIEGGAHQGVGKLLFPQVSLENVHTVQVQAFERILQQRDTIGTL